MKEYMKEKHRKEKLAKIFNRSINGECYFQCPPSYWKNIVFKHYNKIKRKEMNIEQLILLIQKEGIRFTQHPSLMTYPLTDFVKYIAKVCNETIEIES
ncbi:hypothetical protein [Bacillus pseudomycoides]|uniref:hypothetical protein n=1 Tax=Bacillus pseudomycoides TaxID=64104 RepID=UPI000BEE51F2|nr:hypothetical protein [Bacillus pseudomycoides]MED4653507.1 hypothetical protein [Bacillus pseudomycoides]PEE02701.1 hypothetical protein CON86_29630 [Bacillus pseudomycoides]PEM71824.1 hypothetical protein CN632_23730 [Bacillus pseudomycoides]PHC79010.1 hypothetical protein COF63_28355 [Bacillus pseudomycoides]